MCELTLTKSIRPSRNEQREYWLRRVLECQDLVRDLGPKSVRDLELITFDELEEIRRIWVVEKHEFEDRLPQIYEEMTEGEYPGGPIDDRSGLGAEEIGLLKEICGDDEIHFQLVRELLSTERRYRTMARRAGLFPELERSLRRGFYDSEEDAIARSRRLREARDNADRGKYVPEPTQTLLPIFQD